MPHNNSDNNHTKVAFASMKSLPFLLPLPQQHQKLYHNNDNNIPGTAHDQSLSSVTQLNKRRNISHHQQQQQQQQCCSPNSSNQTLRQQQSQSSSLTNHHYHHDINGYNGGISKSKYPFFRRIGMGMKFICIGVVITLFIWMIYMVQILSLQLKKQTKQKKLHHIHNINQYNFSDPYTFYYYDSDDYNVNKIWNYTNERNMFLSLLLSSPFHTSNDDVMKKPDNINKSNKRNDNVFHNNNKNINEENGIYQFIDSTFCIKRKLDSSTIMRRENNNDCYIHFPTACTPISCLVTLKGQKDIIEENDDNKNKENESIRRRNNKESSSSTTSPNTVHSVPNQDRIVMITSSSSLSSFLNRNNDKSGKEENGTKKTKTIKQIDDEVDKLSSSSWFIAGLFDGHGDNGHYSSQSTIYELFIQLLQKQQLQQKFYNCLSKKETIHQYRNSNHNHNATMSLIKSIFIKADESDVTKSIISSGTTAIIVWQIDNIIYMASSGDSTALLIQWNYNDHNNDHTNQTSSPSYRIIQSAIKHKPGDPMERKRIESNGGYVYMPISITGGYESSRVIFLVPINETKGIQQQLPVPSGNNKEEDNNDDNMYIQMGIAMSRSIGDLEAKRRHLLIPDPSIVTIDLNDYYDNINDDNQNNKLKESSSSKHSSNKNNIKSQFFVILATDGLFDVLQPDEIIIPIGRAMFDHHHMSTSTSSYNIHNTTRKTNTTNNTTPTSLLRTTCEEIIHQAKIKWSIETQDTYRDDISLLVKHIQM